MKLPKLIIFSSGTQTHGGSGFENLVKAKNEGTLRADIVAVVSNHENGGVREKADKLHVSFIHFPKPWNEENYKKIILETGAEFTALSGWLKLVRGLSPKTTLNIHPGPLPKFGGFGMYGHFVHEAVIAAFKQGEVTSSEVCMHFVTESKSVSDYDKGPVFFRISVPIEKEDTGETLAARANKIEHKYQPIITDLVVNGEISWDGINPESLKVPKGYTYHIAH